MTADMRDLVLDHPWRSDLGACGCGEAISSADEYGAHIARLTWDQGFDAGTYAPGGPLRVSLRSPLPIKADNPYDDGDNARDPVRERREHEELWR